MKKFLIITVLLITPILAQCDWNDDGLINVIDVVAMVDCILFDCWDGTQCDWIEDGTINIIDVVAIIDCILTDCWIEDVFGCTDPEAINYNADANIDDGSCEYPTTVTDIDGNVYNTVVIGDQEWMAENLKVTHYRNGDEIPNVLDNSEWVDLTHGAYCYYENDFDNFETYGNLYNWFAADDSRNIAPEGWHVPSDEEWIELEMYLGMSYEEVYETGFRGTDEGGKLKEAGFSHWFEPNTGATNQSSFTSLPGGYRYIWDGGFSLINNYCFFWSSTEGNNDRPWARELNYTIAKINRHQDNPLVGFSVRCVRD